MGRINWHGAKARQREHNVLAKHIGGQILKARQKRQLSMRAMADLAGLSATFICQLENGQSIPTAETIWKLSQAAKVPIGYWFCGYSGES